MDKNGKFSYSYSASEQEELKRIKARYENDEPRDSLERIRRLDSSVTSAASAISLAVGIVGTLTLGAGMSLIMTSLGDALRLNYELSLLLGLALGFVGVGVLAAAYPIYNAVVRRRKKKITPEILALLDEVME